MVGAALLLRRHGGGVALIEAGLAGHGCRVIGELAAGDLAVAAAPEGEVGVLMLSRFAHVARSPRGLVPRTITQAPIIAAWRI